MGRSAASSGLPAFLSPLTDARALSALHHTLTAREVCRREYQGQFSACEAQQECNDIKNRYGDIMAYDSTRVKSAQIGYINANWITEPSSIVDGHRSSRRWLAAQAPLENTLWDFWSLALSLPEGDAPRRIVMLTGLVEGARVKCERYIPKSADEPLVFSPSGHPDSTLRPVKVKLLTVEEPNATVRKSRVEVGFEDSPTVVDIDHIECTSWRDHGVPDTPDELVDLIRVSRLRKDDPPTLVHCSAGVGRTGTFIATSCLLDALPALRGAADQGPLRLNLPELQQHDLPPLSDEALRDPVTLVIDHLRAQRCLMVQTMEQQRYIYACLAKVWQDGEATP